MYYYFLLPRENNMPIKLTLSGLILALTFFIAACGSGGTAGGDGSDVPVINGVVAIGAPLIADITVVGVSGFTKTVSNADGSFTADVRGLTAPFVLKAEAADGSILYSIAQNGQLQANITPFTSYIVHQIAVKNGLLGGAWQIYTDLVNQQGLLAQRDAEVALLNGILGGSLQSRGLSGFNHITDVFAADSTGYDAYLDSLDIEINTDDVIIKVTGSTTLTTLSYTLPVGTLATSGKVIDASTGAALGGVTLSFSNPQGNFSATTSGTGDFTANLATHRVYDVSITAPGYTTVNYYHVPTFSTNPISIGNIPMIATNITGDGTAQGQVINARTVAPLTGVTLTFREGINNTGGTILSTGSVSQDGNYSVSVPTGVYTITYEKTGYTDAQRNAVVLGGEITTIQAVPMITSTVGGNSFATMILTWAENPADLDTFLTGPSTTLDTTTTLGGERFKLAYYQKTFSTTNGYDGPEVASSEDPCATTTLVAAIDVDDVTSYGPETTTLCQVETGTYSYYIHHYSGTSSISDSPAIVTVTTASGISTAFIAPPGATGTNSDLWHVFDLDNFGNLTPINTILSGGDGSATAPSLSGTTSDLLADLPSK